MRALTRWLDQNPLALAVWAGVASFSAYFCMYAYRKAFAAGAFEGDVGGLGFKSLYVIAQVAGYAISKFMGIKVVSEMSAERRVLALLATIGASEVGLLLFGLLPAPWSAVGMFLNGLPLGMVWGLVFGFVEGRRTSDLLGSVLCASFIVASGAVKSVGRAVMGWGVSEEWMPATVGLIFFPLLILFAGMLAALPPPSAEDEAARVKRVPMDAAARRAFLVKNAGGMVPLVLGYVLLTAYRDFRDNFAPEIWEGLGYGGQPEILATAELPVAFGSLLAVGLTIVIRSNRLAVAATYALMILGAVLIGGSSILVGSGAIDGATWMIAVGVGLYVGYVPVNSTLADRLVAALGSAANAGFIIYVADATGYLGSVGLLLWRNFGQAELSWVDFLLGFSQVTAVGCVVLFGVAMAWTWRATR